MNKRPIIIDTDPGIDDALAIAIALFSDELDVKLITTVAGNVGLDKVTYNALRLLKYFEREDIPVAMGADSPLIRPYEDASNVHGKSGMEGFDFEEPTISAIKENAVDAMRKVIMESAEPVTLVPIAPLTNIALLLKKIRGKGGGSMIKETIQAVEDAEAKASELVAQASEDARRVKAEAEAEADRMLADAQKRGKEAAVKQEEELTLRGEEYVKQALAEAEAECQTLRETADRRKPEVVDRLIAELV